MGLSVDKCLQLNRHIGTVYISTDSRLIKVVNTAPRKTMKADDIANETAKTGKVTVDVSVMGFYCRKKCNSWSANPGNNKPSYHKAESGEFLEGNSYKPRDLSQKMRKGQILNKLAPKSKKLELNSTNLKLKHA
jgi:hypothetical protein